MANELELAKSIAVIATPIAIGVGFWFARRQLQSGRNARMAQIVISLGSIWESREIREGRCKVTECGGNLKDKLNDAYRKNSPELCILVGVGNFFDHMGVMVMEGQLDCRIAYDLYWRAEEHYYNLYRPILKDPEYKDYLVNFQRLHDVFENERTRRSKQKPRPAI